MEEKTAPNGFSSYFALERQSIRLPTKAIHKYIFYHCNLYLSTQTYSSVAEMPTSEDLKSGDSLFFTTPPEIQ